MWIFPVGAGSQYEVYLAKSDPGDVGGYTSYALGLLSGDGYISGHVRTATGGGYIKSNVTRASIVGKWTHLALTYDDSSTQLYVNGAEAATPLPASGGIVTAAGDLLLGSENAIAGTLLQGSLDDVSIFSRALTAAEVATLAGVPPPQQVPPAVPVQGTCTAAWNGNQYGIVTSMDSAAAYSVVAGLPTLTFTGAITNDGGNAGYMYFQVQAFSSPATGCQGLYGGFNLPAGIGPHTVAVSYDAQSSLLYASLDGGAPVSISTASFMDPLSSIAVFNGYLGSAFGAGSPDFLMPQLPPPPPPAVPTLASFTPSGGQPTAGTPFGGALAGTGFNASTLEVSFCTPDASSCYPQPAGDVQATSSSAAQLTGVSLSAGTWVAKVRNGPSGAWSNTSPGFTVAAPPSGTLAPGTCNPVPDHVGDVSFVGATLDPASTPTVPVLDFTFTSGSSHYMADTHVYFFSAGCQYADYSLPFAPQFVGGQNVVQVTYDTVAGTVSASVNGGAPTAAYSIGTGLASAMVHPSDGISNAANSSDFLVP